jgi:hypothetical protein
MLRTWSITSPRRWQRAAPPSFPETFRASVLWVEARSGYDTNATLGRDEFFSKNVDRALVVAQTDAEAVRKAPRFLIVIIGALECQVMNPEISLGIRVVSWARLLKVYGTMRWPEPLQSLLPLVLAPLGASG